MGRTMVLLFVIPVISIVFIALYQVVDETFKKKFVLERRGSSESEETAEVSARRRYSDTVPPGTLRHSDDAGVEPDKNVPVARPHRV